jgi:hypothetical protein
MYTWYSKNDYCPQNCTTINNMRKKYTAKRFSWSKKLYFKKNVIKYHCYVDGAIDEIGVKWSFLLIVDGVRDPI